MDSGAIIQDIFSTMPSRFRTEAADLSFSAAIGFSVSGSEWTVTIKGKECAVREGIGEKSTAVITVGAEDWISLAAGTVEPVALYLAKKLSVSGDVEAAVRAFELFENYSSELVATQDPTWVIETLGNYFSVRDDGMFMVEGLSCDELAERFGTPLFVTSEGQLRENIRTMKKLFADAYTENRVNVMWAIKSNTTFAFRKIMNEEGAGGDCFSPGEVYATCATGGDPELLLLNGSDRSEEAFTMAVDIGMRITLDHIEDLAIVDRIAAERDKSVRCLIRVKGDLPSLRDVESTFEPGISVPFEVLNLKFGVTYGEAVEIAKEAEKYPPITIEGIHSHIGRDVYLPEHWNGYARDMVELCSRFREDTGITASILDLGGGIAEKRDPSSHDLTRLAPPIEDYIRETAEGIRRGCKEFDFPFPWLWVEPGRTLLGPTTVLISRVGNVKRTPGVCTWVHVDGSCNILPSVERHNGMSYHLLKGNGAREKAAETVDIVGPNCSGDLIQPRRRMPKLERGDLLIFLDVGAYNLVAANQFNSIPRPASVLVSGKQADIVRERETLSDVFGHQRVPARLMI